jgi:hypothetical protein
MTDAAAASAHKRAKVASCPSPIELLDSSSDEEEEVEEVTIVAAPSAVPPPPEGFAASWRDNLKCNICLEVFHRPVVLVPCSHVFCGGCLSGWRQGFAGSTALSCPSCRVPIALCIEAPKPLSNMVNEYLALFPAQARSGKVLRELEASDNLERGVPLQQQHQPPQHQPHQPQQGVVTQGERIRQMTTLILETFPHASVCPGCTIPACAKAKKLFEVGYNIIDMNLTHSLFVCLFVSNCKFLFFGFDCISLSI